MSTPPRSAPDGVLARPGPRPVPAGIPSPAAMRSRAPADIALIAPAYGTTRLPIEHVIDTNVGLHFAHVDRLDLLVGHFGEHLVVVEQVASEWWSQRKRPVGLMPHHPTAQEHAKHHTRLLVKAAASKLVVPQVVTDDDGREMEHYSCVLGEPVELDQDLAARLRSTRAALMKHSELDPDDPDEHPESNYGECGAILYLRRTCAAHQCPEGVFVTNDYNAHEYARVRGIRRRTTRQILDQIVAEGRLGLDEAEAAALYERMLEVSKVSDRLS